MTSKARNLRAEHGARLWHLAFGLLGCLSVVSYLLSLWPVPAGSGDAWEWAESPRYPLRYSTYAYEMGANMIVYAMSH